MLQIARKPSQIDVEKLISLYEIKEENTPSFVSYITNYFFDVEGAAYYFFEHGGNYITALRVEPYLDGFLIAGLQTHTIFRGKGYATRLLRAVTENLTGNIYSHIACKNAVSIHIHSVCGFTKIHDYARLLDGTVSSRYITMKL